MAEASTAFIPPDGPQNPRSVDEILHPLPAIPTPLHIRRQNQYALKTHFPPLSLEQGSSSGNSLPPLLFPLVPTLAKPPRRNPKTLEDLRVAHLQGYKGKKILQETAPQSDKPGDYEESLSTRNSWSYWTGAKGRNGHPNQPTQYLESSKYTQITDGKPEMGLETIDVPQISHTEPLGCGNLQQAKAKQVSLAGLPVSPQNPGPSGHLPQPVDEYQYLYPQNGQSRRSYSLKMNSHPPIHLTQPTTPAEYQRRVSSLARRFDTSNKDGPLHQKGSTLSPDAVELPARSVRRRTSSTTGMKECEEFLLSPLSGKKATSSLYQQPVAVATSRGLKPLLLSNTYQPPVSRSTSRRYSTNSHSTNFSYPRVYPELQSTRRRNTISSTTRNSSGYQIGSNTPLGNNGDYSSDEYEAYGGISRVRSLSEGSREVILRDFRAHFANLHIEKAIELAQAFGGTGERTFINRRVPRKAQPNFFIPDQPTVSPIRNGSRSVTAPRMRIDSRNFIIPAMPSISWRSSGMGLDGEVYDNTLTATNATGYPYCNMSSFPVEDRRRVDDFSFTSTIEAASRPYTPDNFITEEGLTRNNSTIVRSPSKKSVRSIMSWMAIHQHRGRQSVGSIRSSGLRTISRSSSADRNVLVKQKGVCSIWPYNERGASKPNQDSFSSSPGSAIATVGTGILGVFKKQKKVAKEVKDTVKHPHTATTRAGPINIEEDQPPPLRPDVYEPNPMQAKLNHLAKEGKAKYEAVARDIRELLASENAKNRESERQLKADILEALSHPSAGKSGKNSKNTNGGPFSNGTSGSASRTGTSRNSLTPYAPQIMNPDTVRVVSPTSPSGFMYVSTAYGESQKIVEKIWKNGLGGPFRKLKTRKDSQKAQGDQVKVYMKGARGESLTVLEKIGRKIGINNPIAIWGSKSKNTVEAGGGIVDGEDDPLGINLCGAVDITEGRKESVKPKELGNQYGFCDPGWGRSSPRAIWKEFEQGKLVDPVKEKLEAKSSGKLWSSRNEPQAEASMWGRLRKFARRKPEEPVELVESEAPKVTDLKGKGKALE